MNEILVFLGMQIWKILFWCACGRRVGSGTVRSHKETAGSTCEGRDNALVYGVG